MERLQRVSGTSSSFSLTRRRELAAPTTYQQSLALDVENAVMVEIIDYLTFCLASMQLHLPLFCLHLLGHLRVNSLPHELHVIHAV
jgi:hypothetical protein